MSLWSGYQTLVMMVLKFPCCLIHFLHCHLLLFHFGRMYRSCNQNCYCNQEISYFGGMLWSWKYHCCHLSPHTKIEFLCTMDVLQLCLHHCETCHHWNLYLSLFQRIVLLRRVCWYREAQYFRLL